MLIVKTIKNVTQECYDVCTKSGICGKGALCRSLNSKAECECLPGHRGNPYVECSIRDYCSLPSDCPGNLLCLEQYCGCPYPYEQRSSFCVLSSLNCTTTNPCPKDQTCIYDGQGDKTGYCACPKGFMMTL
ncbi:protein delta homolog 2-like [Panonychus citri]|uniref:protein delta homolog 2-like n=1 Tax=Panonychus citri TaxID=50023 RepID=UPI002307CE30|nr:protein delta homolog 2-like [Panonychus citri]